MEPVSASAAAAEAGPGVACAILARGLGVEVSTPRGRVALLAGIDFAVAKGEFACIIGLRLRQEHPAQGAGRRRAAHRRHALSGGVPRPHAQAALPLAIATCPSFAAFHERLSVREILDFAADLRLPCSVGPRGAPEMAGTPHRAGRHRSGSGSAQPHPLGRAAPARGPGRGTGRRSPLPVPRRTHQRAGPPLRARDDALAARTGHQHRQNRGPGHARAQQRPPGRLRAVSLAGPACSTRAATRRCWPPTPCRTSSRCTDRPGKAASRRVLALPRGPGTSCAPNRSKPPGRRAAAADARPAQRQWRLLRRDRGQLWLQLTLLLSFPVLVALFSYQGLPRVRSLSLGVEKNVVRTLTEQLLYLQESFHVAALVSGLAMFQVILLTLMGANNGSREIAKERAILDKERRVGLSPWAYTAGKFLQVAAFSLLQAAWMAWFVKSVCGVPGKFGGADERVLWRHFGHEPYLPGDFCVQCFGRAGLPARHLPGGAAVAAIGRGARPARGRQRGHPACDFRLLGLERLPPIPPIVPGLRRRPTSLPYPPSLPSPPPWRYSDSMSWRPSPSPWGWSPDAPGHGKRNEENPPEHEEAPATMTNTKTLPEAGTPRATR